MLGLSVSAFVRLRLVDQSAAALRAFVEAISLFDDVMEVHLMAGDRTVLLRTYSASLSAHGLLVDRITNRFPAIDVQSDFVQQHLYHSTALPT